MKQAPEQSASHPQAWKAVLNAGWRSKSVWESRIVALVAAKVRETDADFMTYRIPLTELSGVRNRQKQPLRELMKGIERLSRAFLHVQRGAPQEYRTYALFSACGYADGWLSARFDPDLKPYFLRLGACFDAAQLAAYFSLSSSYSQRIFELLHFRAGGIELTFPLDELHETLNTPPSLRRDFKDFRRRVLEQASKEISEKTSLRFTWEPVKQGRSVAAVLFAVVGEPKAASRAKKSARPKEQDEQPVVPAQKEPIEEGLGVAVLALECAQAKGGTCGVQDNAPEVCRACGVLHFCEEVEKVAPKRRQAKRKQGKLSKKNAQDKD